MLEYNMREMVHKNSKDLHNEKYNLGFRASMIDLKKRRVFFYL